MVFGKEQLLYDCAKDIDFIIDATYMSKCSEKDREFIVNSLLRSFKRKSWKDIKNSTLYKVAEAVKALPANLNELIELTELPRSTVTACLKSIRWRFTYVSRIYNRKQKIDQTERIEIKPLTEDSLQQQLDKLKKDFSEFAIFILNHVHYDGRVIYPKEWKEMKNEKSVSG